MVHLARCNAAQCYIELRLTKSTAARPECHSVQMVDNVVLVWKLGTCSQDNARALGKPSRSVNAV